MSTSDPIAPDRLEALLRGEAGADGRERRIGALLDELTLGEISPPAELRERVRSLTPRRPRPRLPRAAPAAPAPAAAAPRSRTRPRRRRGRGRGRRRHADAHARHRSRRRRTWRPPTGGARATNRRTRRCSRAYTADFRARGAPEHEGSSSTAPLPDGQRAQDYAASLRLAVGSVAELSRSTQSVLDTVRSLGGAVETVDYGTPSAGSGSAVIELRVPVGRAQEALRRFSALGTITAQQVQIRDLQAVSTRRAIARARCATASTCSRPSCCRRR